VPGSEHKHTPDGHGRVFRDAAGREWRASFTNADNESVVEFTCISEPREHARVMAVASGFSFTGVADEALRTWLSSAPLMGRLTE
jgi:hypothetical protein